MSLASRRQCDNADGSLKSRFEYADSRLPVSGTIDGTHYYFAYDQVGSLRAVIDASGTVVKTLTYDSFGNVLEDSNEALAVPFGFAGGLYEADTGLVRFGYRDYQAEVGRWTAKDPIGFGGGDSDLYGYCLNDPVNWVDMLGLSSGFMTFEGRIVAMLVWLGGSEVSFFPRWIQRPGVNERTTTTYYKCP